MSIHTRRILFALIGWFIFLPLKQFAAFPVKRSVGATNIAKTAQATDDKAVYHTTSAGYVLSKTFPAGKWFRPTFSKSEAILLAIISLLFGGLGLHRFYMGYTLEGFIQLTTVLFAVFGYQLALYGFYGGLAATAGTGVFLLGLIMLGFAAGLWIWQLTDLLRISSGNLYARDKNVPRRQRRY